MFSYMDPKYEPPWAVKSINLHYLPHPLSELSPRSIILISLLIDFTTLGGAKLDLGPKFFPWPCRFTISQGAAERSDRGIGGGKCSYSA